MVIIRFERPDDATAIRQLHATAFERQAEARLVENLRQEAIGAISLVAERAEELVGHILFTPVTLTGQGQKLSGLGLGPMAVMPSLQRQGIGTLLLGEGLKECRTRSCRFVVVLGHPEYYPRFGFLPAHRRGLCCEFPVSPEVFMLLELSPGALHGHTGVIRYHPAFQGV
jgi:putative acetyltransferase